MRSLYSSKNNDKKKIILKNIGQHFTSKKIYNAISLSNSTNKKNLNIKRTVSIKNNNNYRTPDSTLIKINHHQNNNTIQSNINYNNKKNYYNENNKHFDINDINIATIHSNGKFRSIKHFKNNIRKRLYEKNIILSNNFLKNTLNKNISIKLGLNKDSNIKSNNSNWKRLNISSHYIGNINNNKFGVTTKKFCVNKNIILTFAHNNLKLKNNINTSSLIAERNIRNKKKEFKTINIPNHNTYFNGFGTTNFFPKIKNTINNEKLYKKLMDQMTLVFNNKLKEYSLHKSNEKNSNTNSISSSKNNDFFRKTLKNIKQQRLFSYDNINKNGYNINYPSFDNYGNNNISPSFDKNDSYILNSEKTIKTNKDKKSIYKVININKNFSNRYNNINLDSN